MSKPASILSMVLSSRLPPPASLTPTQAARWTSVLAAKPSTWMDAATAPVLKEYVRAEAMCDVLAGRITDALAAGERAAAKTLLDLRDREARRMASIATKLRMTQQTQYTHKSAATASRKGSGSHLWR
ncbi:MAG: hypothetical protein ACXIUZ_01610 [Lysobacteraceae bacterium]